MKITNTTTITGAFGRQRNAGRSSIVSHAIVSRPAAGFGYHPIDVLRGVFDIASLAMNAILGVYLQSIATAVFGRHVFVNTCKINAKKKKKSFINDCSQKKKKKKYRTAWKTIIASLYDNIFPSRFCGRQKKMSEHLQ